MMHGRRELVEAYGGEVTSEWGSTMPGLNHRDTEGTEKGGFGESARRMKLGFFRFLS